MSPCRTVLLSLVLWGCSPETAGPGSSAPIDTGDLPYLVHGDDSELPSYDEDELSRAVETALAELVNVQAQPYLSAYDSLLAHAGSSCPDWLNADGYTYWVDDCTTESGALLDGFGTKVTLEDYEDPDGTIWNQTAVYMLGELKDADGNSLVGTGSAYESTALDIYEQQITMTNIVQGYELSGDFAAAAGLETEPSPRLYRWTLTGAEGVGSIIHMDALTELDSEEADLLLIEDMLFYDEAMGSDCPIEPAGSISLRLASGQWLDLSFDGPRWDGPTEPELCDGCGEIWAREEPLGELCLDFSVLLEAEAPDEGGE